MVTNSMKDLNFLFKKSTADIFLDLKDLIDSDESICQYSKRTNYDYCRIVRVIKLFSYYGYIRFVKNRKYLEVDYTKKGEELYKLLENIQNG